MSSGQVILTFVLSPTDFPLILKNKNTETEADRVARINAVNKYLYGVDEEIPRSEILKLIEDNNALVAQGKTPKQYPTRMHLYNDTEMKSKIHQGIREKFEDGDIFVAEQQAYLASVYPGGGKGKTGKK